MGARFLRMLGAYLLSAAVAALIIAGYAWIMVAKTGPLPIARTIPLLAQTAATVFLPLAVSALLPSAIVAVVAEIYRLRSIFFYLLSAAVVGVVSVNAARLALSFIMYQPKRMPHVFRPSIDVPVVLAGLFAGLVYWLVAGRSAGARRTAA